jgi:hypothetical protein
VRPVSIWVLASNLCFGGGGWSGAGGDRERDSQREYGTNNLGHVASFEMHSDSARHETGAGMRRNRVAFASAADIALDGRRDLRARRRGAAEAAFRPLAWRPRRNALD